LQRRTLLGADVQRAATDVTSGVARRQMRTPPRRHDEHRRHEHECGQNGRDLADERHGTEAADRDAALARLTESDDVTAAVAGADCVIEAVPERMDLKREIFEAIDRAAPAHALLATSSLPIADLAAAVADPSASSACTSSTRARDEARRGRPPSACE
jgi:hypothetical protein